MEFQLIGNLCSFFNNLCVLFQNFKAQRGWSNLFKILFIREKRKYFFYRFCNPLLSFKNFIELILRFIEIDIFESIFQIFEVKLILNLVKYDLWKDSLTRESQLGTLT